MIQGCVGLPHTRDPKQLADKMTLKASSLVTVDTFWEAIYAEVLIPEDPCHLLGRLIFAGRRLSHSREVVGYYQYID